MTKLLSILAALSLLVAPIGAANGGVTTNIPGAAAPSAATPTPATPAPAPAAPEKDPKAQALKALKSLKTIALKLTENLAKATGAAKLAGVQLSGKSGFALVSIEGKGMSATVILGYDDETDTWQPMDIFIPITLPEDAPAPAKK